MLGGTNLGGNGSTACERELSKYKGLFASIINQAERDKYSKDKVIKEDALKFLASDDMKIMLDYVFMECE